MKIKHMFRAFGLNPPMEGRPRGTLTLCDDNGFWVVYFDYAGQRWEGRFNHLFMIDQRGASAQLGEGDRDLGNVKVVGVCDELAALEGGRVPSFEVYNRLPVSAEQVTTAAVRVSAKADVVGR